MEGKPIRYQPLDPAGSVITVDDDKMFKQKSLHLKFDAAQINRILIKLSKQCNLTVRLFNADKIGEKDAYKVLMQFYTSDPPQQIYNSIIDNPKVLVMNTQTYTQMKVYLDRDDVGIYNVQLFGFLQPKVLQTKLDQFLIKPLFQDNTGSYGNFTSSITINRDPAGREKKANINKLREEQELQDALKQSYLDAQIEEINQKKHLYQKKKVKTQFDDDDEMSLEVIMMEEQPPKEKQIAPPKDLGYTDQRHTLPPKALGYTDQQKPKFQQSKHNKDEIKLNWMIKFKHDEIDRNFMLEHAIRINKYYKVEQSVRRNRGLKEIMYN